MYFCVCWCVGGRCHLGFENKKNSVQEECVTGNLHARKLTSKQELNEYSTD